MPVSPWTVLGWLLVVTVATALLVLVLALLAAVVGSVGDFRRDVMANARARAAKQRAEGDGR